MEQQFVNSAINVIVGIVITWLWTKIRDINAKAEQREREEKERLEREREERKLEIEALKKGLQAMLRDRIIQSYNHYVGEKKWIPIYARDSVENCFEVYETLGKNGVINDLMTQMRNLPNIDPKDKE